MERVLRKRDYYVSMEKANVISLVFALPPVILFSALFSLIWGYEGFGGDGASFLGSIVLFLLAVVAGVVIHELLHGVAWALASGKPFDSVEYGFKWKTLTPFAHCKAPICAKAYRIGALMPGLVLGILPATAGLLLGSGGLLVFGIVFTAAAGGDFLILWMIRNVPSNSLVEDHPTRAGCYVFEGVPVQTGVQQTQPTSYDS